MPYKILAAIISLAVTLIAGTDLPVHASGGGLEVKVVSTDAYGLTIELSLPDFKIKDRLQSGGSSTPQNARPSDWNSACQEIVLAGWAKTSRPGHPELPLAAVLIQTPQSGEISLEELGSTSESLPDVNVCPVPRLSVSEDGQPVTENDLNDDVYLSSDFLPGTLAELTSRSLLRDTTLARIMMYPFQWNPATKELRYFRQVRLRVQFQNPLSQHSELLVASAGRKTEDIFAQLNRHSVINYQGPDAVSRQVAASPPTSVQNGLFESNNNRLRIEIKKDGIYRLSYNDLIDAGVNAGTIDPHTFQLFNRDKEVAIKLVSKLPYRFTTGDCLEFYAQGISTHFTDTNVYWLSWGDVVGKRVTRVNGRVAKGKRLNSFNEVLRVEENHLMWDGMPEAPEKDYWFWEKITAPLTKNYALTVPSPVAGQANATVRVGYRGRSTPSPHPNHHTRISLNGTQVNDKKWDGDTEYVQQATLPPGLLANGTNTLTLAAPGDTKAFPDIFYFNWVEVRYARNFLAVDDMLPFSLQGNGKYRVEVKGLSKSSVKIYEVTDPFGVREVVSFPVRTDGSFYRAEFEDSIAGSKNYHVATVSAIAKPYKTKLWQPADMNSTSNGADLIVITADEFRSAVEPLCTFHQNQGLRVKLVSVEDIYNEFNHGIIDPAAIRDFLKAAYERWQQPAPSYVLLVGDANIDYRDYLGTGKKSRVPTHLSLTDSLGLTPDDNWYVCVAGNDSLPDMLIGRLPGSSAGTVSQVVNKIIDYEQSTDYQPSRALFAADNNEIGFENLNEDLVSYLPSGFDVHKAYLRLFGNTVSTTQYIISSINEGMLTTTYVGHGDVITWAGEQLFDTADVSLLNNPNKLTFLVTLDCLNGYFAQPFYYSLAEEFVVAPNKGAVASFSPSGLGYLWEHKILGNELFSSIFKEGKSLFGVITTQSKMKAYARGASEDILKTFTLLVILQRDSSRWAASRDRGKAKFVIPACLAKSSFTSALGSKSANLDISSIHCFSGVLRPRLSPGSGVVVLLSSAGGSPHLTLIRFASEAAL